MGRPRKNQTLTTLETLDPKQVAQEALDQMVAEGEAQGLYSTPDRELVEPTAFTAEPAEVPEELKNTALSIVRNPVNQHWMLVQFKFDYASKTVGPLVVVEEHSDRIEIVERFKMIAGTELMSAV